MTMPQAMIYGFLNPRFRDPIHASITQILRISPVFTQVSYKIRILHQA